MEACAVDSSSSSSGSGGDGGSNNNSRRFGINIAASNLLHAPLTTLLEYSGILGGGSGGGRGGGGVSVASASQERESLILSPPSPSPSPHPFVRDPATRPSASGHHHQEVTIRIIGTSESNAAPSIEDLPSPVDQPGGAVITETPVADGSSGMIIADPSSSSSSAPSSSSASSSSSHQRYDIQNFARWIEQILPFSLLLLLVFIRQHLQGIN